jgi:hypothetical protein
MKIVKISNLWFVGVCGVLCFVLSTSPWGLKIQNKELCCLGAFSTGSFKLMSPGFFLMRLPLR